MAINTINEKHNLIDSHFPYPSIPISSDSIDQADKQQLLGEYPGILWDVVERYIINCVSKVIDTINGESIIIDAINGESLVVDEINGESRL